MIIIDFSIATAAYISVIIFLVMGHWIFYNYFKENDIFENFRFLKECPYCIHIYYDYSSKRFNICPRCHSHIGSK